MQIEALTPVAAAANTFAEEYKSFAQAVDATRHKLPVKNVHIGEDPEQFLGEICSAYYFMMFVFIYCAILGYVFVKHVILLNVKSLKTRHCVLLRD